MQSASTLPEASDIVEDFRDSTLQQILARLSSQQPRPALRTAPKGWLGYIDAAILDWVENQDLDRQQLRDLLLAAFDAAITAAQTRHRPQIKLQLRQSRRHATLAPMQHDEL